MWSRRLDNRPEVRITPLQAAAKMVGVPDKQAARLIAAHEMRLGRLVDRADPMLGAMAAIEAFAQIVDDDNADWTANESLYHCTSARDADMIVRHGFRATTIGEASGVLLQRKRQHGRAVFRVLVPVDEPRDGWLRVEGGGLDGWLVPVAQANAFYKELMPAD